MDANMIALMAITLFAATVNGALGYGFSSITVPVALLFLTNRVLNPALVPIEVVLKDTPTGAVNNPDTIAKATKVELLLRANDAARSAGSSIVQVSAGTGDSRRRILVANTDGLLASDEQVRVNFRVSAVASGDTGMQTGVQSIGATIGFELFDQYDVDELARRAAEQALTKLRARPAPSGSNAVAAAGFSRCAFSSPAWAASPGRSTP